MDNISRVLRGNDLVVVEGGGFVGANAATALSLERVRERFACIAWQKKISTLEVSPDHWRSVLQLAARPRSQAVAAQRSLCKLLAGKTVPTLRLADKATNDDKRAALLIGWACCKAWNWNRGV
tara:strand:- start:73 stop:441 length:369 start_codon:yes stop_codon:yes gene_type:complete